MSKSKSESKNAGSAQTPLHLLGLFLVTATLASCASFPSTNQDPAKNNKATYDKDLKECRQDYPEAGSGVHIRQWIGCMNLKGWK